MLSEHQQSLKQEITIVWSIGEVKARFMESTEVV